MPIFQMIIVQVIIFAIVVFLLKKFVYQDITVVLERLKRLQAETLLREEELKGKIDKAKKEYELKMLRGEEEIRKIKDDAKVEAQKIREEILENAKQEGEAVLKEALMKKDDIRTELEAEVNEKSVLLAQKIVRSLFSSRVVEEVHHQLIDEAIKEIMQLNSSQIQGVINKIVIVTPIPLSPAQREKFSNYISTLAKKKISFQEEIDKTIIAGLIIKLDSLMLDASMGNRLHQIVEMLKDVRG